MAYEDALAHLIRREISQQLNFRLGPMSQQLARTAQDAQAAMAGPGSVPSPAGEDPGGGSEETASSGVDYAAAPPREGVLYDSVDARIDNLDAHVGLPFGSHNHDGTRTPKIPAASVLLTESVSGSAGIQTLEQFIIAKGGGGARMRVATAPFRTVSFPVNPYLGRKTEVEDYHRLEFRFPEGAFRAIVGAVASLVNLRVTHDGQPFEMWDAQWVSRHVQAFCSTPAANTLAVELVTRFSHLESALHPPTQGVLDVSADVGILVFGD